MEEKDELYKVRLEKSRIIGMLGNLRREIEIFQLDGNQPRVDKLLDRLSALQEREKELLKQRKEKES